MWDKAHNALLERRGDTQNFIKEGVWRSPLLHDARLLNLAISEQIREIVSKSSPYFDFNQQNAVYAQKEHGQDRWHRDIPYQEWIPHGLAAINILFLFSDSDNRKTPALEILESSHCQQSFPCAESVNELCKTIRLSKYEFLVMNSFLFHRASIKTNKSSIILNHIFAPKIFSQQVTLAGTFGEQLIRKRLSECGYSESDEMLRRFLGLDRKSYT